MRTEGLTGLTVQGTGMLAPARPWTQVMRSQLHAGVGATDGSDALAFSWSRRLDGVEADEPARAGRPFAA